MAVLATVTPPGSTQTLTSGAAPIEVDDNQVLTFQIVQPDGSLGPVLSLAEFAIAIAPDGQSLTLTFPDGTEVVVNGSVQNLGEPAAGGGGGGGGAGGGADAGGSSEAVSPYQEDGFGTDFGEAGEGDFNGGGGGPGGPGNLLDPNLISLLGGVVIDGIFFPPLFTPFDDTVDFRGPISAFNTSFAFTGGNGGFAGDENINFALSGDDTVRLADIGEINNFSDLFAADPRVPTDTFFGGEGNDTLTGGDDDDKINGDADEDLIVGNEGDDILVGGGENDDLQGEEGDDWLFGDNSPLVPKLGPNSTPATAQNLDPNFATFLDPNVFISETVPHVSVEAEGDGTFDWYSFTVTFADSRGYFDIDFGDNVGGDIDTELFLFDSAGNLLDGSNNFPFDPGSTAGTGDPRIAHTFVAPGTYFIAVGEFDSGPDGTPFGLVGQAPDVGDTYQLNVSIENHEIPYNTGPNNLPAPVAVAGDDLLVGSSGDDTAFGNGGNDWLYGDGGPIRKHGIIDAVTELPMDIDPHFSLFEDPNVASSAAIPHVTIKADGDDTFDFYQFTVPAGGGRVILDIDAADFDTVIFLFDVDGTLIDSNDDNLAADPGSLLFTDSFLDIPLLAAGTYSVAVGGFPSVADGTPFGLTGIPPAIGQSYMLNVSVEGHAGVVVTEGDDYLDGGAGSDYLVGSGGDDEMHGDGDEFAAPMTIAKAGPNDTPGTAQNVDADFILLDVAEVEQSREIPHVSIEAEGDGDFDWYEFTVSGAGLTGIFDIDFGSVAGGSMDSELFLFDAAGNLLVSNDDNGGDPGSYGALDSRFTHVFGAAGTFYIAVGRFDSTSTGIGFDLTGSAPLVGDTYQLNISIEDHPATDLLNNDDTLLGGAGDDTGFGDVGNDILMMDDVDNPDGMDTAFGGDGNDTIYGDDGDEVADPGMADSLFGGAGNDTIMGEGGDDSIGGGNDEDTIDGGTGSDTIDGDDGDDVGGGNDTIIGASGDDVIRGEGGNDTILGDSVPTSPDGMDTIFGGTGDDTIIGDDGEEMMPGPIGDDGAADSIFGGDGNDSIEGNGGDDFIDGGEHNDSIIGQEGADSILGGNGEDSINGDGGDDTIDGDDGDDVGGSNDTIIGASGDDVIRGEGGNDIILGDSSPTSPDGMDTIFGGTGDDTIIGDDGEELMPGPIGDDGAADSIFGGDGNDSIEADGGDDFVDGGEHNDVIVGEEGADSILGGNGNDSIDGGIGDDEITGDDGDDAGGGDDSITGAAGDDTISGECGNDILFGDTLPDANGSDTIFGGDGNDSIYGDDESMFGGLADSLFGGGGEDFIFGQQGADTIEGGTGNDIIEAGGGPDRVRGDAGEDSIDGGDGSDLIFGDDGDDTGGDNDSILGAAGDDTLFGEGGDDILIGDTLPQADGSDTIFGGDGNDTIFGDDAGTAGGAVDTIEGGAGNDSITGEQGADIIDGNTGSDTIFWVLDDGDDIIDGGTSGGDPLNDTDTDLLLVTGDGTANTFNVSRVGVGPTVEVEIDGAETLTVDNIEDISIVGGGGMDMINIGNLTGTPTNVSTIIVDAGDEDDTVDASGITTGLPVGVDADMGNGDDTFMGGAGSDSVNGGAGEDTMFGGAGDDILTGGPNGETKTLPNGSVVGTTDLFYGGAGDDTITGDANDLVFFSGDGADYSIDTSTPGMIIVTDNEPGIDGDDGTDTIFGIDAGNLIFNWETTITIQPIQVQSDDGSVQANAARELYVLETTKIYNQIGIGVNFLNWNILQDSTLLDLSYDSDNTTNDANEFDSIVGDPGSFSGSTDASVVNMWFIQQFTNNDTDDGDGPQAAPGLFGLGRIGSSGVAVADNIFTFNSGVGRLDTIAHEVGHNLGLRHNDPGNTNNHLMQAGATRIVPQQIDDIAPTPGVGTSLFTATQISDAGTSGLTSPDGVPDEIVIYDEILHGDALFDFHGDHHGHHHDDDDHDDDHHDDDHDDHDGEEGHTHDTAHDFSPVAPGPTVEDEHSAISIVA